jgi:Tfp pilus assembly protein PilV
MRISRGGIAGFSLVEVLIAVLILIVCLAGMAHMLAVSISQYAAVREFSSSLELARAKLEELATLAAQSPSTLTAEAADGVSLDADVAGRFDRVTSGVVRRWRVSAGPTPDTIVVTVRVISVRSGQQGAPVELVTILRHGS